jgi:hypothetical protein
VSAICDFVMVEFVVTESSTGPRTLKAIQGDDCRSQCVFITAGPITKLFAGTDLWGGRSRFCFCKNNKRTIDRWGEWRTCAMRDL